MKRAQHLLLVAFYLVFAGLHTHAQTNPADRITGIWLTEQKDGKIEISRTGNTYTGKLIWGNSVLDKNGNPKHDVNNPDPKLRQRTLQGMVMLTGLQYEDGKWQNGKIYNGLNGKSYRVVVTIEGNKLELRGYIGLPLFGKTTVWQRVE
jgi:uncharacterized protein (DUF2147 family)